MRERDWSALTSHDVATVQPITKHFSLSEISINHTHTHTHTHTDTH